MSEFFNNVMAMCKAVAVKKETDKLLNTLDAELTACKARELELETKKAAITAITGKAIVKADKQSNAKSNAKSKAQVTCESNDLIVNVAANVLVKDICRNIERKLQRNLIANNEDDKQLLYNHLYYFYAIKHSTTLPEVIGRNKTYHLNDYVAMRTHSVINDVTCHINFK